MRVTVAETKASTTLSLARMVWPRKVMSRVPVRLRRCAEVLKRNDFPIAGARDQAQGHSRGLHRQSRSVVPRIAPARPGNSLIILPHVDEKVSQSRTASAMSW